MRRVVTAFVMLAGCAILAGLGAWQMQRLHWKEGLIARIEAEKAVDPKTVNLISVVNDEASAMRRGYVIGRWQPDRTMRVGPKPLFDSWGYWIVTPLVMNNGETILVNRGWVDQSVAEKYMRMAPLGRITAMGTLRGTEHGTRPTAGNGKLWHELDSQAMAKVNFLEHVSPLVLFMEKSVPPDIGALTPAPSVAELRNEHLHYAMFWFTMAGGLFIALLAFSLRGRRSVSSQGPSDL